MSLPVPSDDRDAVDAEVDPARVLEFEAGWTGTPGAKEGAIRSQLGLSATRYYRLLHRAIDDPAALARDPLLVRRLQRIRAGRTRARAARSFGRE